MKILIAEIILLVCVFPLAGRERMKMAIGTDATSAIFESRPELHFQYGFSRNWSAGAFCGINIGKISTGPNTDEIADSQGHGIQIPSNGSGASNLIKFGLFATYWPKEVFNGPFLCCGATYVQSNEVACAAEVGWYIRIASIAAISLSLKGEIKYAEKQEKIGYEIFRIGFHFCF